MPLLRVLTPVFVGLAMIALPVLVFWQPFFKETCSAQPLTEGIKWCGEWWLYRYQGFLGALATLAAGYLAWRAVDREIKEQAARDLRSSAAGAIAAASIADQVETEIGYHRAKIERKTFNPLALDWMSDGRNAIAISAPEEIRNAVFFLNSSCMNWNLFSNDRYTPSTKRMGVPSGHEPGCDEVAKFLLDEIHDRANYVAVAVKRLRGEATEAELRAARKKVKAADSWGAGKDETGHG